MRVEGADPVNSQLQADLTTISGEGVEDHRVVLKGRGVDSDVVVLFRELVG